MWLALWEARVLFAPELELGPLFSRFAHDGVLLIASAFCLWAGVAAPNRRERRAWLLVGIGVAAWTFGELYYTAVLWTAEVIPIPSPADAGYLLFPPLMLVGVLALLRSRTRDVPGTLWADGITAALAVSALGAALVFQPVYESASGQGMEVAINLAYPLSDLVLLGVIVGALAGTGWQLDRTWVLFAAGILTFWLADSLYLVGNAKGTYVPGAWFEIGWWVGLLMIGVAAWQPARPALAVAVAADERMRRIVVPLAFGATSLALLVYGCLAGLNPVAIGLAGASLVAVMTRTMLTFRDNVSMLRASREEAQTDALTGLGNRRALARVLDRELPRATLVEPLVLVLFDLDGFKHYNDTFGHPAGDALLIRLGGSLVAFLGRRGVAFRMGGDEFCALLMPGERAPDALVAGAARASPSAAPTARSSCRARRPTPRRRCASRISACTRRSTPAAPPPAARARTCCCARSPSATLSCATTSPASRTSRKPPRCAWRSATRRSSRSASRPSSTTSARSPCPMRSSRSPGRSTRTSGSSSAATR